MTSVTRQTAFTCKLTDGRGTASVWVAGTLDSATAPELERVLGLAELRAPVVVLDLRELTSIDLDGVRVIGYASLRARRIGRRLIVVRGAAQVDRVFAHTGASEVVKIVSLDPAVPPVQALLGLARVQAA